MTIAVMEAASWSGCAAIFVTQLAARWVAVAAGALQRKADQQGGNAGALSRRSLTEGHCGWQLPPAAAAVPLALAVTAAAAGGSASGNGDVAARLGRRPHGLCTAQQCQ
jgi:hypothetical protein